MTTQPADEATTDLAAVLRSDEVRDSLAEELRNLGHQPPLPSYAEVAFMDMDHLTAAITAHVAEALAPYVRQQRAAAWDECLATVTRGVENARNAHDHRAIRSALSGLVQAIPRTDNPYRAEAERRGEPA